MTIELHIKHVALDKCCEIKLMRLEDVYKLRLGMISFLQYTSKWYTSVVYYLVINGTLQSN